MNEARVWVVLIGAASEIAQDQGKLLKAAGFSHAWFSSTAAFLDCDPPIHPSCIALDFNPDAIQDSIKWIQDLVRAPWRWPVLVFNSRGTLPPAVSLLRIQNFVFLEEPYTHESFLAAVRDSTRFQPYRKTGSADSSMNRLLQRLSRLTPRELVMTGEMLTGRSIKETAAKYAISPKTVELHRSRIFQKMHVDSTLDLQRLYLSTAER